MGEAYCLICDNELPENRRLTCSQECYRQYLFHKEEFKRDITKKPDSMLKFNTRNEKRTTWQRELDAYQAGNMTRACDFCGREFIAKTKRSYCCSPLCYDLKKRGLTQETA